MNLKPLNPYKYFHIYFFLFFISIYSCAKPGLVVVDKSITEIGSLDSAQVVSMLKEQEEKIYSVRGLAIARLRSPDQKISFRQVTIVESPNKLRLEALAPLGSTELAVISNGKKVLLKFPKKDVLYNQLEAFNFSVFYPNIPVPINIGHLSNFLLGRLPIDLYNDKYLVEIDEKNNSLILTSTSSDNKLWIDYGYFRIKKASFLFQNEQKIVVNYDEFKPLESVYFPRKIELNLKDYSIKIKYDFDVDVNETIKQSLFNIDL
jgi:outer membrane lipoprotein-sorting protein